MPGSWIILSGTRKSCGTAAHPLGKWPSEAMLYIINYSRPGRQSPLPIWQKRGSCHIARSILFDLVDLYRSFFHFFRSFLYTHVSSARPSPLLRAGTRRLPLQGRARLVPPWGANRGRGRPAAAPRSVPRARCRDRATRGHRLPGAARSARRACSQARSAPLSAP